MNAAEEAIAAARAAGVELKVDGDHLILDAPAVPPPDVPELLKRHKTDIVRQLLGAAVDQAILGESMAAVRDPDHPNAWESEDLILETGFGLLIGPASCGKSFLALHLGHAVAAQRPFFGTALAARGGAAFLLTLGEMDAFEVRLGAFDGSGPLPIAGCSLTDLIRPEVTFDPVPDDWSDRISEALADESSRMRRNHGGPSRFVVIDSLWGMGLLRSDHDIVGARALVAKLRAMAEILGLFILVVCPRQTGDELRAVDELEDEADLVLEIAPRASGVNTLSARMGWRASARPLGTFHLKTVTMGSESDGDPITTCVVDASPAPPPTARELIIRRCGLGNGRRHNHRRRARD